MRPGAPVVDGRGYIGHPRHSPVPSSAITLDPSRQKLLAEGPLRTAIPKISDFGLAKRLELNSQQTRSGSTMGSPSYETIEKEKQAAIDAQQAAEQAREEADENAKTAREQSTLAVKTIQLLVQKVQQRLSDAPATQAVRKEIFDLASDGLKEVADKVDSSTSKDATQLAILQGLGSLFAQLGETAKAYEQFKRAEVIARGRVQVKEGSDASRSNLAAILRSLGQTTQEVSRDMRVAQQLYERCRATMRELIAYDANESGYQRDHRRDSLLRPMLGRRDRRRRVATGLRRQGHRRAHRRDLSMLPRLGLSRIGTGPGLAPRA